MRCGLGLIRSRRLASASMALRMSVTRSSPVSNRPSRRAVVPSAKGRVIRSGNSLRRPTPRGFSYVRDSIKRHLFVCTLLTAYHRYDNASIVDTKGSGMVNFNGRFEHDGKLVRAHYATPRENKSTGWYHSERECRAAIPREAHVDARWQFLHEESA